MLGQIVSAPLVAGNVVLLKHLPQTSVIGEIAKAALFPEIAEGCYSNSGQSCCSVERIYADRAVHDDFVDALWAETEN